MAVTIDIVISMSYQWVLDGAPKVELDPTRVVSLARIVLEERALDIRIAERIEVVPVVGVVVVAELSRLPRGHDDAAFGNEWIVRRRVRTHDTAVGELLVAIVACTLNVLELDLAI